MKKYLFGTFAIVLALAFSAFNTRQTDDLFEYLAPGGSYSKANVETEANWEFVTSASSITACPSTDHKACQILVSPGNRVDHDANAATPDRLLQYNPIPATGVDLKAKQGLNATMFLVDPSDREYITTETTAADNKLFSL